MSRVSRLLILTAALAVIAGCAQAPPRPDPPPRLIQVPITKYVPIDKTLTEHVPIAMPADTSVIEAIRVARERRGAIEQCNRQLDAIDATQPREP